MSTSLIFELPKIVEEGKKEVERILERISSQNKLILQTNEMVLPAKDNQAFSMALSPTQKKKLHSLIVHPNN